MKRFLTITLVILSTYNLISQRQANIWYFGHYAGLDFNSGVPIPLLDGKINRWEGVACFSDSLGNLLLYTDGDSVWNKLHQPMHNGFGLGGHESSTESAIIVPLPNNDSIYYVFTVDAEGGDRGLCYSIINIKAQNGLGSVIAKNIQLQTPVSEKVTAVKHQNNKDIWIISHGYNTDSFFVYLVTDTGLVQPPQIFEIGTPHLDIGIHGNNAIGYMRASPDGTRLALVLQVHMIVEIYDFDNSTGVISNPITIQEMTGSPYGVEFSPDASKLYFTTRFYLKQINLNLPTVQQIINSVTIIDSSQTNNYLGALQLATDGKIYLAHEYQPYLGVIHNPTETAANCNFQMQGVWLGGRISRLGLPNFIQSYFIPPPFVVQNICFGDSTLFYLPDYTGVDSLTWYFDYNNNLFFKSNQMQPKFLYTQPGRYKVVVEIWRNNFKYIHSRIIQINTLPEVNLGSDTIICKGQTLRLLANAQNCSFLWNNNSTNNYLDVTEPGIYWLNATNIYTGCHSSDTITVDTLPLPVFSLGKDTAFCYKDSLILKANIANVLYLWNTGNSADTLVIHQSGVYWLKVVDSNQCSFSDTINVEQNNLPMFSLGNDTIICPNTSITLHSPPNSTYLWQDSSAVPYKTVTKPGIYWLQVTDSNNCRWRDTIQIFDLQPPSFQLPKDTILCEGQTITLSAPNEQYEYLWNDFFRGYQLQIDKTGYYWLKATNICGSYADTIFIKFKYCGNVSIPNIFTPNNDGINDVFYIKGIEGKNWHLQIYNRWGDLIYYTNNYPNDWDGNNAPDGTYYYILFSEDEYFSGFLNIVRRK